MKRHATKTIGFLMIFILVLGWGLDVPPVCGAESAEQFYRGKTITWVVSSQPGTSTDVVTRILYPHVARETGAKVVVKNMTGGSLEGDNWVYNEAKRNGLTMLTEGSLQLLLNDLLRSPGVQYATEKFNFLTGVDPTGTIFALSPKSSYRTMEALRKAKGLKAGASSSKGYLAVAGAIMLNALGLEGRVVTGYSGMTTVTLAVAQGEMDIVVSTEKTLARETKQGNVVPLFIIGDERSPLLPDLPSMREFGATVPKELADACKLITNNSWGISMPPAVPADRVNYIRKVFKKISALKEVQQGMAKWSGDWRPFIPGEKMQEDIGRIKANKILGEQLDAILKKYTAAR